MWEETRHRARDADPSTPRDLEVVRVSAGPHRRRFRGAQRGDHGPRRRQRRRQVDPDQVRGRHSQRGQRRDPLRREARSHQQPEGLGQARNRGRLPGPRAVRQPRRRPEHVPGPRGARLALAVEGAAHGATNGRDPQLAVRHDHPLDPPAGCLTVGRPAPVGRRRQGRAVELQARHSRRADRRARRRADAPGARARQAPCRAGPGRRAHLAQPARRLRSGDAHHGVASRPRRGCLRTGEDDATGSRAGDHRWDSHEGGGHPVDSAGAGVVSSEVDIAAPGIGLPEGDEAEAQSGLGRRAYDNLRTGNLGILPIVIGLAVIVVFFSFKATNFFTADNFNNIIVQMAGLTMLAFGVVFVLLLGEIDLSIGYLSGIAALAVAEFQLPGSGHAYPGVVAIAIAIGLCALIGGVQGSVVALVGVPSFVVTLAGLLIWQGVILQVLEIKGVIVIQDAWINDLANYYFTANAGWIIAAVVTGLYAVGTLGGVIGKRRAGVAIRRPLLLAAKIIGVAVACFGTVAVSNHASVPNGLPLAGVLVVVFLVGLTFLAKRTPFGRHVYAVGGNAEGARRAGINVARIRIIVFMISGGMAGVGGVILAARLNSVDLNVGGGTLLLDAISAAVIGGTSLFGGRGEVRSALIGALVISTVSNGLNTAGYKTGTIYIVTGVILLLAVTLDTVARRLQVRSGR